MKRLRETLNTESLETIYYAIVQSHLVYRVGKKQIIKVIFQKNNIYYSKALYTETKILDPRQLYFLWATIEIHRTKHNLKTV